MARNGVTQYARRTPLGRQVRATAPVVLTFLALALVLPMALQSELGAAFALVAVVMLATVIVLGLERSAVAFFCIGALAAPWNRVHPVASLSFVTVSDVCLVVGILLLIPVVARRQLQVPALYMAGAAGVVAMGLLASIINPDPLLSLNAVLRLVVGALLLPVVFSLWRPHRQVVVALASAFVLGNIVNVAQSFLTGARSGENRYIGLTEHPNHLGLSAMLGLALTPFLLQQIPRRFTWVVLGSAAACGVGIWISGSRAAIVVAVAIMLLYPLLARSIEVALALAGLAIIPLYIVGNTVASGDVENNVIGRLMGGGSATGSDLQREQVAAKAIDNFTSHPLFGTGFGNAYESHDIYLQIAAAGGLAVLVFYIVLLLAVVRQPFLIGSSYRLLALPAISYVLIGPLTPLLWDRYIWIVLALPFLVPLAGKTTQDPDPSEDLTIERVAS